MSVQLLQPPSSTPTPLATDPYKSRRATSHPAVLWLDSPSHLPLLPDVASQPNQHHHHPTPPPSTLARPKKRKRSESGEDVVTTAAAAAAVAATDDTSTNTMPPSSKRQQRPRAEGESQRPPQYVDPQDLTNPSTYTAPSFVPLPPQHTAPPPMASQMPGPPSLTSHPNMYDFGQQQSLLAQQGPRRTSAPAQYMNVGYQDPFWSTGGASIPQGRNLSIGPGPFPAPDHHAGPSYYGAQLPANSYAGYSSNYAMAMPMDAPAYSQQLPSSTRSRVEGSPYAHSAHRAHSAYPASSSSYHMQSTSPNMARQSAGPSAVGMSTASSSAPSLGSSESQRQKPRCWDHGCNGREFSTFSNLLRHQREKDGTAAKSYCPRCGAEFTRSTACTNHLLHAKCKPRSNQDF